MVMRALIEEGGEQVAREMRCLALTEGALFHHLLIACFTQGKDTRSLAIRLVQKWVRVFSLTLSQTLRRKSYLSS